MKAKRVKNAGERTAVPTSQPADSGGKASAKSSAAEIALRTQAVYKMIVDQMPIKAIRDFGVRQWGVSPRQVDRYAATAREWLAQSLAKDRDLWLKTHSALRMDLYTKAERKKNLGLCVQILDSHARLLGLFDACANEAPAGAAGDIERTRRLIKAALGARDTLTNDADDDTPETGKPRAPGWPPGADPAAAPAKT